MVQDHNRLVVAHLGLGFAHPPRVPLYVMFTRHTAFWLVGPFDTVDAAAVWSRSQKNNPDDDPRWQVIALENPDAPVIVVEP